MDAAAAVKLISEVGFPIFCVIVLGVFVFIIYKQTTEANENNIKTIQENNLEREKKLFEEIKVNREINAEAIKTIALYATKLDTIQHDVSEIKTDIITITAKIE